MAMQFGIPQQRVQSEALTELKIVGEVEGWILLFAADENSSRLSKLEACDTAEIEERLNAVKSALCTSMFIRDLLLESFSTTV